MAVTPYSDLAYTLASGGDWDTVLDGSQFSLYGIVWNTPGDTSSGIDTSKSRWLLPLTQADDNGGQAVKYSWSSVSKTSGQFLGKSSVSGSNQISFMSGYGNELSNYLVSNSTENGTKYVNSYTTGGNNTLWDVTATKSEDMFLIISIGINGAEDPLVEGSVGTDGMSSMGIFLLTPGKKFMTEWCNLSTSNLITTTCISWCAMNPRECQNSQNALCQGGGTGVGTTYCLNWCEGKNVNCDSTLKTWCTNELTAAGNDLPAFMDTDTGKRCACFLPDNVWNGYSNTLQTSYEVHVGGNSALCFYPPCTVSTLKPFIMKNECGQCPLTSGCLQSVVIDYNGDFVNPPVVSSSEGCKKYNQGNVDPNVPLPKPPNMCTQSPANEPTKVKKKTNIALIFIIIVIFVALFIFLFKIIIKHYENSHGL